MAVVATADGQLFAVPDQCPHARMPLSDGYVDGGRLVCAYHGWEFELSSGVCVSRAQASIETTPLTAIPTRPSAQGSLNLDDHEPDGPGRTR